MYSEQFGLGPQSAEAIAPATISEAGPPPQKSRWAAQLRRIVREPLTHFLILGIAIFIAAHVVEERSTRFRIAIAQPELNRIVASYTQQYGSEPTPDQLRTMVDNYVREEIFLREGIALGLDRNDEIVRRRIAQKYDFLQQDNAVAREPSESQLRSWFAAHPADFRRPVRRSFEQLYFAADARGDAAARQRAEAARFRRAEVPFVVRGVPSLDAAAAKWSRDEYLLEAMGADRPYPAEVNSNGNHFM